MSLITCASYASVWRGYEYYEEKKVHDLQKISETEFCGIVDGSDNKNYTVKIDTLHPRKSSCNCPHADGRRIVCKHMIALFFTAFPNEATKYYDDCLQAEKDAEAEYEAVESAIYDYVHDLSAKDARNELLNLIDDLPDRLYKKFINEHYHELEAYKDK